MKSRTETGPRKLGLDKPCADCGEAIYFGYKGPIDGICGRCADKRLRNRVSRSKTRTVVREGGGMGALAHAALIALAFAAGAAAMYFAYPHLPV